MGSCEKNNRRTETHRGVNRDVDWQKVVSPFRRTDVSKEIGIEADHSFESRKGKTQCSQRVSVQISGIGTATPSSREKKEVVLKEGSLQSVLVLMAGRVRGVELERGGLLPQRSC